MGVTHKLILGGGGASLPTILNVTVSGSTATAVTASLGSRSVALSYDSTSDYWTAALPKGLTGNWTITATDGEKTASDLVAISGPGVWSVGIALSRLPSGYTELEYIQSSGAQLINTGLFARPNYKIAVSFRINDTVNPLDGTIIGANGGSPTNTSVYYLGHNLNSPFYGFYIGYSSKWHDITNIAQAGDTYAIEVSLRSQSQTAIINGETKLSTADSIGATSSVPLYLFGRGTSHFACIALYYLDIYDLSSNGALVRSFVPARNANDAIGLYDLINNVFYSSTTSTPFIAGPEV